MQLSNIPGKLVLPFANAGGKSTIPVASQIGITAGAASLTDGFPPLTRTPVAAGGVPPSGLDMNGILYEMSAIIRWANAGGGYPFDNTFATDTNVGGYPKGARIMRADGAGYWYNTTDNNVTDPESSWAAAAGWVPDFTTGVAAVTMTSANVTLTPAQYGKPTIVITGALTGNLNLIFPNIAGQWVILNGTTGGFLINAKTELGLGVTITPNFKGEIFGDGTNITHKVQDLYGADGSKSVGFIQGGTGAVARTMQDKSREIVSIADYGASSSASAAVNTTAIKNALAYLVGVGGGTLLVPKVASAYLINDTVIIGDNIRIEFEQFLQLNTASSTGTVLFIDGDNIELINPLIDGGGVASDAGENGIGVVGGNNIHIQGGKVKNCNRGGTGMMYGGKGVQIESGGAEGVLVDGTEFSYCFMAMSTIRDGLTIPSDHGIQFTNIKADNCDILFFVKQANIDNINGIEHTVQLNNFYAVQCGAAEGVMQFSRAANVQVSNGVVINTGSTTTALIRGNHRYCRFDNIRFSGNCARLIDLDPSTFAVDSSHVCTDNTYNINYSGVCNYVAYADPTTTNRILQNSRITAVLSSDVATKIVNDELRNGYCVLDLQIPQKNIYTTTATFYLEARSTFASYPIGISVPRFNGSQIAFPSTQIASSDPNTLDDYEENAWTPTDASGAGLTFTTAYGDYVKVGKLVTASFTVTFPITASVNNVQIGGLPVASQNVSGRATSALALRFTDQGALMTGTNNPGTSTFLLVFASGTFVTNVNMSAKTISGVLTYMSAT